MELFQKFGEVANKTCKKTSENTNRFATITKLKWQMNDYKSKISKLYEDLGKVVYEDRIREKMEDTEERINEKCIEIDELAKKIEENRKKILKLNNKKQCQNCYTEICDGFNYCPVCGKKQDEGIPNEEMDNNSEDTKIED